MKMSSLYMPTLREVPNDADVISSQYLLRAGMVRKLVSGVYSFLPLGFKVLKNVENIVREEMDRFGAQEALMSAIQPREIWEESGRWENFGPEMFKLQDRHNREFCLGPTHEEYFTYLVRNELKSYKQLPLNLYQIQTKYRDERRPRFGLVRAREFIMKDAYTFDVDQAGLEKSYMNMWKAYEAAFDRIGLKYKVVQGDSGNMGGSLSHEFIAITPSGESTIAYCDTCDYAATDEVAKCIIDMPVTDEAKGEMKEVHTPDVKTIDELKAFFKCEGSRFIKTLLFKDENNQVYAAMIPGHRDLNLVKLCRFLDISEDETVMLEENEITPLTGSYLGFVGPFGLKESVKVVADKRIFQMTNAICGANKVDYHLENVNLLEDDYLVAEDLLQVEAEDACPTCGKPLFIDRGTEVGNIFQLGDKYSKSLKATFLDADGKAKHFQMGSYGIGISRTVSAIVEQCHDDRGIVWPRHLAPYELIVNVVNAKKADDLAIGEDIYRELQKQGYNVVLDDRKERAGVKFNDADLIGFPLRIVVGKSAKDGIVEVSLRSDGVKEEVQLSDLYKVVEEKMSSL